MDRVAADPPANPRLDRQLDKLDRLGDLGLEIAEALAEQARGGRMVVVGDLALAYDRVARAVRMAALLHAKLIEDARRPPEAAADPKVHSEKARKERVARIVYRVAQEDERFDGFQRGLVRSEVQERLEHDDIYGKVMSQPVSELVSMICEDLGLNPDWSRLAAEAWAQDEIHSGEVGEPLRELLEDEEDEPDPLFTSPNAEALAGGGPIAERSEERWVEGEGLSLPVSAAHADSS